MVVFAFSRAVLFRVAVAVALMTDFTHWHIELRDECVTVKIRGASTAERCLERARRGGEVAIGEWACGSRHVDLAGPVECDSDSKVTPVPAKVGGVDQSAAAAV